MSENSTSKDINSTNNKADRNKESNSMSNKADRNKESNSTSGDSNSVGPTRRYVSGDEEKSSSSHQFHKS